MGVDLILKIAGIAILTSVLNQILAGAKREDMGMLVSITGLIIIFFMIVSEIGTLFQTIRTIFNL